MCGITGIFSLTGKPVSNAWDRIHRMTALLEHRGPDSQGSYLSRDGFLALGNTRLAIVDPENRLHQPLESSDGGAVLSFNGEIYNYEEEMQRLVQKGIRFRSHMDTEVLLEGLRAEGESFLNRLDGMWAFAYYQPKAKKLLLSRDLMGERHLFYRIHNGEIVFASEVKPILVDSDSRFEIDFDAFLTALQYFAAPPGRSMLQGIHRMLAGHNIVAEVGGDFKQYRYKRLHPEKWFDFFRENPPLAKVLDLFEETFQTVCKKRLPQEVPFFCTLSGGLDSALICLYASDFGKTRIRTLYGQSTEKPPRKEGDPLDEFEASRFISKKLNTQHDHIHLNSDDVIPVLKRLSENAFDGMFDNAVAAFEMLSRYIRQQNTKVILIAEGPDEFLGYPKDLTAYLANSFTSNSLFRFLPVHESWETDIIDYLLTPEQVLSVSNYYGVMDPTYQHLTSQMDPTQLRALSYAALSLPDMFNLRADKAYMNASVEARLPYQAPQMVEFLIAMPARFRFNGGETTKYPMRKIVEKHIGPEIACRAKYGFAAPIWLSPNVYRAMDYEEVIRSSSIFDHFPFKKGVREFILKSENRDMLWPFYVLSKAENQLRKRNYE